MTTPPTPPTDNLAAEGGPRSEMSEQAYRHCRWFDPHPPVPLPGSEQAVRATGGRLGATCATCGEALTSDVIPTDPEASR